MSLPRYNQDLKQTARRLRREMTDAERALWERLRRKQIQGIQFYRQSPIGNHVVDFCAPQVKLVVEVDGSQHLDPYGALSDAVRDTYLRGKGLRVLRFNNLEVLQELEAVVASIFEEVTNALGAKSPFGKGGWGGFGSSRALISCGKAYA